MTVARRWLRDRRRALIGWCLGMCALVLVTVAFFPTVEGDRTFEDLTDRVPEGLRSVVGLGQGAPVTTAPGAATGRRGAAIAAATTVAVAGYLVEGLLGLTESMQPLREASPWHWYLDRNMLVSGTAPAAIGPPLLAGLAIVAVAGARFARRDLR